LLNPEIPLALESVILKALEKSPSRRFQTAEALAQSLQGSVRPSTTLNQPTQTARPVTAPLSRPPLRLVLADDHNILRRTLASFLSERDDMMVVGEASDGEMALQQRLRFSRMWCCLT
jgi:serine/threonine protein kinase